MSFRELLVSKYCSKCSESELLGKIAVCGADTGCYLICVSNLLERSGLYADKANGGTVELFV